MPIQAGCLGVRRTYEKECNNAVLDFLNQPLSGTSSLILVAVLAVVIFVAIKLGHKKARDISKQFLTEHPNAATLYLYGEDLPSNSAELDCIQGTVSKVYDPRTVPGAKAQKGVACHVLPGKVELNVMITWSKSYYVVRNLRSYGGSNFINCITSALGNQFLIERFLFSISVDHGNIRPSVSDSKLACNTSN